jgi:hypothetical protein
MGGAASKIVDTAGSAVKAAGDIVGGGVKAVKDNWVDIRDTAQTAAVIAGNTIVPGSSMLTSKIVSDGSQKQLSSDLGQAAQLGSSIYGASNLGATGGDPSAVPVTDATPVAAADIGTSSLTAQQIASANGAAMGSGEALAYGTGAAVLANQAAASMTPEMVPGQPQAAAAQTMADGTAGEKRATASEISNVMTFQSDAAMRKRASGAAILSNTAPGSAVVGAKKLMGA